jgi:hypothetical protein
VSGPTLLPQNDLLLTLGHPLQDSIQDHGDKENPQTRFNSHGQVNPLDAIEKLG